MNITLWILAGGVVGWLAFSALHANEDRGVRISVIIGMVGGFFGGSVLAPMFSAAAANPTDFNAFALFIAMATAAASLTVANILSNRYGV